MRYVLCLCASLFFSTSVLAFGSGGSLGGNPGEASGGVNAKTPLCLDVTGERIPDSYQTKYQRQCEITGNTMVDLINYNNYYRNKPNGESLSDIRAKAS
ncbi:hypothetical protein C9J01_16575 [Photobacterium rosenbergii]|uniref:Uncharacterized protein n=1 Tax=Photobacterium rosenbergii TaxID=294936 RepID=A0A2T3NB74_9GAMM|nr:hypothetical protein [Photobacterium rosenbergii]PSW11084.1 hypothetical protein C9J01_16575 [Photobacterium rosenbergii]